MGANVTRDRHQIKNFILKRLKKEKRTELGRQKYLWGKFPCPRPQGSVPSLNCF